MLPKHQNPPTNLGLVKIGFVPFTLDKNMVGKRPTKRTRDHGKCSTGMDTFLVFFAKTAGRRGSRRGSRRQGRRTKDLKHCCFGARRSCQPFPCTATCWCPLTAIWTGPSCSWWPNVPCTDTKGAPRSFSGGVIGSHVSDVPRTTADTH